ncbi:MAG: type II toxin-antitoxin system prevent-host-death family antitoxin [Anaerolineae bacterium]
MSFSIVPVSDLRKNINALLSRLTRPVFVSQHGRVKAVLLDIDRYNEMLDDLEDMRDACDPEIQAAAVQARKSRERGETVPLGEVLGKYDL